jgi:hypothetical protein
VIFVAWITTSKDAVRFLRARTLDAAASMQRGDVPDVVPLPAPPNISVPVPTAPETKTPPKRFDEYRLAIGTPLAAELRTPISSASSESGDQVDATLTEAVTQDGVELIPAGSVLHGSVVEAVASSTAEPRGYVAIAFVVVQHSMTGSRAAIKTRPFVIKAEMPEDAAPSAERHTKVYPVDVVVHRGHRLQLTLAEPLLVRIPRKPA